MDVLRGQAVIELYNQGKDAWNQWVNKNINYQITFLYTNFEGIESLDFSGFIFPEGGLVLSSDTLEEAFKVGGISSEDKIYKVKEVEPVCARYKRTGSIHLFLLADISNIKMNFAGAIFCGDIFADYLSFTELNFNSAVFHRGVHFKECTFKDKTIFSNVSFGGDTDFYGSHFVKGIYFIKSKFQGSHNLFRDSIFECGVNFYKASFTCSIEKDKYAGESGAVSVSYIMLGDDICNFERVKINGKVNFSQIKISGGRANFTKLNISGSGFLFAEGHFVETHLDFSDSIFDCYNVNFSKSYFKSNSKLNFEGVNLNIQNFFIQNSVFNLSDLCFDKVITKASLDLSNMTFLGNVSLKNIALAEDTELSLRGSIFEKSLDLSNNTFKFVPDLVNTKLNNQLSLSTLICAPRFITNYFIDKSVDKNDHEKLRRLKEIAELNHDHEKALYFFSLEQKCKRWAEHTNAISTVDCIYDLISRHGRSVKRPMVFLFLIWFLFSLFYCFLSPNSAEYSLKALASAALSMKYSLPLLIGVSDEFSLVKRFVLGSENTKLVFTLLISIQFILSAIGWFLLLLGIRNVFRIK